MSKAAELAALIGSQSALSNRNLIINGAMQVAQRGTSVTGLTSSSTYHTVDRWQFNMGSIGTFSISQSTTAPSGFSNSLKLSCTTANASPAAGAYLQLIHKIEGQNLQHLKKGASDAESVTLSFWCRCSKTGDFVVELRDGANNRHICSLVTISSADTWEYKTITFAGDTTGTLANDNTTGFELGIWLSAGTDFTSGTLPASWASSTNANRAVGVFNLAASTDDFYITGVQLEVGEQATPFEHRSYGDELARCQRYYFRWNAGGNSIAFCGGAFNNGTSDGDGVFTFPVRMRIAPTALEQSGTASDYRIIGGTGDCTSVPTFLSGNVDNIRVRFTDASSLTNGGCSTLAAGSTTGANAYLGWSAEL